MLLGQDHTLREAAHQLGVAEQTYSRWRKDPGKMDKSQARKLKDLERGNAKLKKLVVDLSLDNAILEEGCQKSDKPGQAMPTSGARPGEPRSL